MLSLLGGAPAGAHIWGPAQPGQPASGPGGADYLWSQSGETDYVQRFNANENYWIYRPAGQWLGSGSAPSQAPVVVVLHGWWWSHDTGTDYLTYGELIDHLVRKGNIVIFPAIQSWYTQSTQFTPNAEASVADALARLSAGPGMQPDFDAEVQLIGFSIGGAVAVNLAGMWDSRNWPGTVGSIVAQVPAFDTAGSSFNIIGSASELAGIPPSAILQCIVMDEDSNESANRVGCDQIWNRTPQIPSTGRNYIWVQSDHYGIPDLIADHDAGSSKANDMPFNWYLTWKLADAARDCSRDGSFCATAIGNTPAQRFMGLWGDGTPVAEPSITAVCPPGCSTF